MKVAVLGPISTLSVSKYLHKEPPKDFPAGVTGAPFLSTLIQYLLSEGHEVYAITSGGYEATRTTKPVSQHGERFHFYCCPSRRRSFAYHDGMIGRMVDFFNYERSSMLSVLKSLEVDIVHSHWTYEYAYVALDSGRPHVITAHDDPEAVLRLFKNPYRLGRYLMARSVLNRSRFTTAVSGDLANRLRKFTQSDIEVIPNPLADSFFTHSHTETPANIPSVNPRIISVVNGWTTWKNMKQALRAFALIRAVVPNSSYHIYGTDYQHQGPAHLWALRNKLHQGVEFHGPTKHDDLIDALHSSSLLLHPSLWEACPMAIVEALSCGTPAIVGKHSGGAPWVIGNGGRCVDVRSPRQIASTCIDVLTNRIEQDMLASNARLRAVDFHPNQIVPRYIEAYERSIKQFTIQT